MSGNIKDLEKQEINILCKENRESKNRLSIFYYEFKKVPRKSPRKRASPKQRRKMLG